MPNRELLKQALDALETVYDAAPIDQTRYDLCNAIRDHLARPAPAPVLWVPPEREGEFHHDHASVTGYRSRMAGWMPLYAAPPAQPAPAVREPVMGNPISPMKPLTEPHPVGNLLLGDDWEDVVTVTQMHNYCAAKTAELRDALERP